MSGSSRHSSVRPPATGGRPGSGGRAGERGPARQASRPAADAAAEAQRVAGLLEPVVTAMGMDLEGVRITAAGRRRLLRIVIDADGGVSLDDIAVVSRGMSAELDASPVMGSQPYTLEVSSPGVDRPLTERRHWRRAIGRLVRAPLTAGAAGGDPGHATAGDRATAGDQVTVEGRITGASAHAITLEVGGQARQFGYGDLGPGKIQIEFAPIGANLEDPGDEDPAVEDTAFEDTALEGTAFEDTGEDESADEEGSDGY